MGDETENPTQAVMRAMICKFQLEAVHHRQSTSESYQHTLHRHLFHFTVTVNAADDGVAWWLDPLRIRRMCLDAFPKQGEGQILNFDDRQALDLADMLARKLWEALGGRGVRVEVLEDGENGGVVTLGMG